MNVPQFSKSSELSIGVPSAYPVLAHQPASWRYIAGHGVARLVTGPGKVSAVADAWKRDNHWRQLSIRSFVEICKRTTTSALGIMVESP